MYKRGTFELWNLQPLIFANTVLQSSLFWAGFCCVQKQAGHASALASCFHGLDIWMWCFRLLMQDDRSWKVFLSSNTWMQSVCIFGQRHHFCFPCVLSACAWCWGMTWQQAMSFHHCIFSIFCEAHWMPFHGLSMVGGLWKLVWDIDCWTSCVVYMKHECRNDCWTKL